MKQKMILTMAIGAGALIALIAIFHQRTVSPATLKTPAPPIRQSTSAIAASPVLPMVASASQTSPAAIKIPDAFENFSAWAAKFTNGTVTIVDGERFAWKRREAMLDLIQNDPQRAIEMSVPFELRQMLPPQVANFLEEQVDGRGDLEVLAATDFNTSATTISHKVQIGERRFDAFVYGRRSRQISQSNIPLHGVALDGKLAVSIEPLRELSVAEATALDSKTVSANAICSVSGKSASWRGHQVFAEGGGGVLHFCGVDHLDAANAQLARAESGGTSAGRNPVFPTAADDA
jgi:hypothetical protein